MKASKRRTPVLEHANKPAFTELLALNFHKTINTEEKRRGV